MVVNKHNNNNKPEDFLVNKKYLENLDEIELYSELLETFMKLRTRIADKICDCVISRLSSTLRFLKCFLHNFLLFLKC